MCRNIKMLFNFDPPVTPDEIQAASLQFVRKISGFNKPSKANEQAFLSAVHAIADISTNLLNTLETNSPPKSREEETARLKARSVKEVWRSKESRVVTPTRSSSNRSRLSGRKVAASLTEKDRALSETSAKSLR